MDVLLTGADGYIGSRVAAALDRAAVGWSPLAGRLGDIAPRTLRADVVINCAGALRSRPDQLERANALGPQRLAAGLADAARIVHVSTRSVYPRDGHRPVDEDTRPAPFDAYGRSKLAGEEALRASPHRVAVLRVSGVFGHPARNGVFLDRAVDLVRAREPVPLADPDRPEDPVAVDWLAEALVVAALTGAADGRTLNLGGPIRPLSDIVAALGRASAEVTGQGMTVTPTPLPVPATPLLDSSRALTTLRLGAHPTDVAVFATMLTARSGPPADPSIEDRGRGGT